MYSSESSGNNSPLSPIMLLLLTANLGFCSVAFAWSPQSLSLVGKRQYGAVPRSVPHRAASLFGQRATTTSLKALEDDSANMFSQFTNTDDSAASGTATTSAAPPAEAVDNTAAVAPTQADSSTLFGSSSDATSSITEVAGSTDAAIPAPAADSSAIFGSSSDATTSAITDAAGTAATTTTDAASAAAEATSSPVSDFMNNLSDLAGKASESVAPPPAVYQGVKPSGGGVGGFIKGLDSGLGNPTVRAAALPDEPNALLDAVKNFISGGGGNDATQAATASVSPVILAVGGISTVAIIGLAIFLSMKDNDQSDGDAARTTFGSDNDADRIAEFSNKMSSAPQPISPTDMVPTLPKKKPRISENIVKYSAIELEIEREAAEKAAKAAPESPEPVE
mmetsp:Transcript_7893/g.9889  ORF Transcript_7893/g.9889 Transcript_7893/m.9889 type:complete len:394 (+) Transcript_7893:182-1363(+)